MESGVKLKLYFDVLPKETKIALDFFSKQDWLANSNWYLAGGTALALQTGNRKSLDLDFFTTDKDFDVDKLLSNFDNNPEWEITTQEKNTVYGALFGAKISFIAYPFFIPEDAYLNYGSVRILEKSNIAIMKIIAVSQRGKKRDFFDLYWCAKNIMPLWDMIGRLKKQYPNTAHDYHHILKSLVYFNDAEEDIDPKVYFDASWKEVKKFFETEVPKIMQNILENKSIAS